MEDYINNAKKINFLMIQNITWINKYMQQKFETLIMYFIY